MIVKSFVADTVAGALKMARSELGGDAIIMKTRRINEMEQSAVGGRVEVTACVDRSPAVQPNSVIAAVKDVKSEPVARVKDNVIPPSEITQKLDFLIDIFQAPVRRNSFPGQIGRLFTALLHADVPETIACEIADRLNGHHKGDDDYDLIAASAVNMLLEQMPKQRESHGFKKGQKIALVGPAGGGKTLLMGRLTAHLLRNDKLPICLTSLDQVKISAPEELQSYAEILQVDHFDMPRQVDTSLIDKQGQDRVTFIDTPALNARERDEIDVYAEKLSRIKPNRIIGVFPATFRTSDLMDMLRSYRPLKLTELAVTMTDQTCRLGGIIALSIQSGLPVTVLGTGRRVNGIELTPDYRKIIQQFLGVEEGKDNG